MATSSSTFTSLSSTTRMRANIRADPLFADKATRTFWTHAINNDMTWRLLLKMLDAFYLKSFKNFLSSEAAPHPAPLPASGPREIMGESVVSRAVDPNLLRTGLSGSGLYEKSGSRAARRWVGRERDAAIPTGGGLCLTLIA